MCSLMLRALIEEVTLREVQAPEGEGGRKESCLVGDVRRELVNRKRDLSRATSSICCGESDTRSESLITSGEPLLYTVQRGEQLWVGHRLEAEHIWLCNKVERAGRESLRKIQSAALGRSKRTEEVWGRRSRPAPRLIERRLGVWAERELQDLRRGLRLCGERRERADGYGIGWNRC